MTIPIPYLFTAAGLALTILIALLAASSKAGRIEEAVRRIDERIERCGIDCARVPGLVERVSELSTHVDQCEAAHARNRDRIDGLREELNARCPVVRS